MSGDDLLGGGDAEEETDIERARIAQRLIADVRGLPPQEVPDALCRACVGLLPTGLGLSVSVLGDNLDTGVVLCAGNDVSTQLAELQYTLALRMPSAGRCSPYKPSRRGHGRSSLHH
ncbi:hypothetical protein [Streptomyces canus]|uniref:hypothetical protein n=1 Tax=Streptomyces canus TaxID=58343 RepID=UPI00371D979C